MKHDQDTVGGSVYTSDSLDSEPDAPFRIIDPSSLMEDELFEEDDYEDEDEEYDEEELMHFAEARPVISQPQEPQQKANARQRKQQIQPLIRDDDDQFNLLTVQEYSAIEKQTKNKFNKKSSKDKLYMLNPDDFKNDRLKQQQIRRAKVTHNHHRRKNREIQRLQGENKRLKDLVGFYEQREKRIRQNCRCEEVSKLLDLTSVTTVEEITSPKISTTPEKPPQSNVTGPPEVIEIKASPPPLRKKSITNPSQQDSKCSSLPNKDGNMAKPETGPSPKPSPAIVPGPSASASSFLRKQVGSSLSSTKQITESTRQSLPSSFLSKKPSTTTATTKPGIFVPSVPPTFKNSSAGPSTSSSTRNVLVINKGINGTTLVKVPASALSSFAGAFDNFKPAQKPTETKRTYSRVNRRQNNKPAASSTPITTTRMKSINPLSRLQHTLKTISSIVERGQNLRNGTTSHGANTAKNRPPTSTGKLLGTEITQEILRYWSDEVIPLPTLTINASPPSASKTNITSNTCHPSYSPPDIINNDEESSGRRKRSAATSRLSTAELLRGTTGSRLQNKCLKMSEHIRRSSDLLDCVDWDTIELQYLQPRQIYAMKN